jgi:hypothetical protein
MSLLCSVRPAQSLSSELRLVNQVTYASSSTSSHRLQTDLLRLTGTIYWLYDYLIPRGPDGCSRLTDILARHVVETTKCLFTGTLFRSLTQSSNSVSLRRFLNVHPPRVEMLRRRRRRLCLACLSNAERIPHLKSRSSSPFWSTSPSDRQRNVMPSEAKSKDSRQRNAKLFLRRCRNAS